MSAKDIDRYEILKRTIRKELTNKDASRLLSLSVRHIKRLKAAVKQQGPSALIHASRGKPGCNRIPDDEREKIISLLHEHYHDFGPTFASEKLEGLHGINRDPKTIRDILIAERLWKPRSPRAGSEHRSWRQRKDCYGELIQFDGSYEDWFEGRGDKDEVCLLAAIDDATGIVTGAKFVTDEGVFPVFAFWKEYVAVHGKPKAIYVDKFSTYRMHMKEARENQDTKTQFGRAMESLAIEPIFANSAQAKGRVERLFGTFQDRLIKEMRLAGISTIDEANRFLEETFIPWFNKRFGVAPRRKANLHRVLAGKERAQLDATFSRHDSRIVQNDFTIQRDKQFYQLAKDQPVTICKKDKATIEEWLDHTIHIRLRGKELNCRVLPARPKPSSPSPWVIAATAPTQHQRRPHAPSPNHPWKRRIHADALAQQLVKVGHF